MWLFGRLHLSWDLLGQFCLRHFDLSRGFHLALLKLFLRLDFYFLSLQCNLGLSCGFLRQFLRQLCFFWMFFLLDFHFLRLFQLNFPTIFSRLLHLDLHSLLQNLNFGRVMDSLLVIGDFSDSLRQWLLLFPQLLLPFPLPLQLLLDCFLSAFLSS